jgi:GAF domain-containing protein
MPASDRSEPDRAERSSQSDGPQEQAASSGPGPDEPIPADLGELMGQMARSIQQEHGDVAATLQAITSAAVRALPGATSASTSLVTGRTVESRAATGALARAIDSLQTELGEGPCLDALREASTVRVEDFTAEHRWPEFSRRAAECGAGSSISFQLFVEGDNLGALNIYARRPHAFGEDAETIGLVFASHAAIGLASARQEENLRRAVDGRDLIGQAKGILMERHKLTADQAFQVLVRASSATNRKLFDIAEELTATGELPRSSRSQPSRLATATG